MYPAMRGDTWRAGRIEQWLFQWQPRDNRGGEPVVHRHPGSTGQQDHHLLVDGLEARNVVQVCRGPRVTQTCVPHYWPMVGDNPLIVGSLVVECLLACSQCTFQPPVCWQWITGYFYLP